MSQQAEVGVANSDLDHSEREDGNRVGERLQKRILSTVFLQLAQDFFEAHKQARGIEEGPSDGDLAEIFEGTLVFLYRLLFLLFAESRALLPLDDATYFAISLRKIQEEIAAGGSAYSDGESTLYGRLLRLFELLDKGDPALKVPACHAGLFAAAPAAGLLPPAGRPSAIE